MKWQRTRSENPSREVASAVNLPWLKSVSILFEVAGFEVTRARLSRSLSRTFRTRVVCAPTPLLPTALIVLVGTAGQSGTRGTPGHLAILGSPFPARPGRFVHGRSRAEHGMATSEYAVGTLGACLMAGVLLKAVDAGWIEDLLKLLIDFSKVVSFGDIADKPRLGIMGMP